MNRILPFKEYFWKTSSARFDYVPLMRSSVLRQHGNGIKLLRLFVNIKKNSRSIFLDFYDVVITIAKKRKQATFLLLELV